MLEFPYWGFAIVRLRILRLLLIYYVTFVINYCCYYVNSATKMRNRLFKICKDNMEETVRHFFFFLFFSFSFLFFLVGSCWMSRTLLRTSWYLTPSVPSRGVVASNRSHANVRNSNDGMHQRTMVGMMQRNGPSWNKNQTGFSLSESVLQMMQSRTLLLDTAILGTYLKMAVPPPSLLPLPWYLHHMAVAVLFKNDLIILLYFYFINTGSPCRASSWTKWLACRHSSYTTCRLLPRFSTKVLQCRG